MRLSDEEKQDEAYKQAYDQLFCDLDREPTEEEIVALIKRWKREKTEADDEHLVYRAEERDER